MPINPVTNLSTTFSGNYFGAKPDGHFHCQTTGSGYSEFRSNEIIFADHVDSNFEDSGNYAASLSFNGLKVENPTGIISLDNLSEESISDYKDYLYLSNTGAILSYEDNNYLVHTTKIINGKNRQGIYFNIDDIDILSYLNSGIVFNTDFDINYGTKKLLDFNGGSGWVRVPTGINLISDKIYSNNSICNIGIYEVIDSGIYSFTESKYLIDWKNKILSSGWNQTGNILNNYNIANKLYVDTTGNYLLNKINIISGNLIATGLYLNNKIDLDSGHLISTGQYLLGLQVLDSGHLVTTGQYLQSAINIVSGDLVTDKANLVTTGQYLLGLQVLDSGHLVTTGQYLKNNIDTLSGDIPELIYDNEGYVNSPSGYKINELKIINIPQELENTHFLESGVFSFNTGDINIFYPQICNYIQELQNQLYTLSRDFASLQSGLIAHQSLFDDDYIQISGKPMTFQGYLIKF